MEFNSIFIDFIFIDFTTNRLELNGFCSNYLVFIRSSVDFKRILLYPP